jgi:hypothetical protein
MKGVVEPAPDLQMTMGRGQEKGLPYVLDPPSTQRQGPKYPRRHTRQKGYLPLGQRGKIDKNGLR